MKKNSAVLISILVFAATIAFAGVQKRNTEGTPFAKLESAERSSVKLTFRESGVRYSLCLNDKELGISKYGQVITMSKFDHLSLKEKHSSFDIWVGVSPAEKLGITVKSHSRDSSGKKSEREYFIEAN